MCALTVREQRYLIAMPVFTETGVFRGSLGGITTLSSRGYTWNLLPLSGNEIKLQIAPDPDHNLYIQGAKGWQHLHAAPGPAGFET